MGGPWSVVIPSDDAGNLKLCVASLVAAHPRLDPKDIIVVTGELKEYPIGLEITMIPDSTPFNFARRVNIGCSAAGNKDVFVMGDDVEFMSDKTIDRLSEEASFRILAPTVRGRVGPAWQREGCHAAVVSHVAFIGVFLEREILEMVGPLWEGFPGYGYEDLDYCFRAKMKGLSCAVSDITIRHSDGIPSSFLKRHGAQIGEMERAARAAFMAKYSWCSFPLTANVEK